MNLLPDLGPSDGNLHRQNTALLVALATTNTAASFQFAISSLLQGGDVVQWRAGTATSTAFAIITNANAGQLIIIIGGMSDLTLQAPSIIASWSDRRPPQFAQNVFANQAAAIGLLTDDGSTVPYTMVRIIGHSWGGAVAMWIPNFLTRGSLAVATNEIYTYGAPKPSSRAQAFSSQGYTVRRVFIDTDPVPGLPPSSTEFGQLWQWLGVPTARQWNTWFQPVTGLTYNGNGILTSARVPLVASTPSSFFTSVLSWITGTNAFGAADHSINSYQSQAQLLNALEAPQPQPAPQRQPAPRPITGFQLQLEQAEALADAAANIDGNRQAAAVGIQAGVALEPGVRFRGIRIGGVQWVYYGDTPIATTRTLRTRRALVRYLNRQI
jgi:hypothetical protein